MNSANVRVFQTQDILCPDTEPLCIASSNEIFWVALSSGVIRGYSTQTTSGNAFNKLYEFRPLWSHVVDMHYLHHLKRLVTCERRVVKYLPVIDEENNELDRQIGVAANNAEEIVQQVCRVYHLMWDKRECLTKIGVYTLSAGNNVDLINVCLHSNAIQVCESSIMTIWTYPSNSIGTKDLSSISLRPICIAKIHSSFTIKCMSIYKQFIGYASNTDIRIVKLKYVNASTLNKRLFEESYENGLYSFWGVSQSMVDNLNFVEVRFNALNYDLMPSSATFNYLHNTNRKNDKAYDIVGETPTVNHPVFVNKRYIETCTNLLHKHLIQTEIIRSIHFIRNISQKKEFYLDNAGTRCIISTSSKGYVYDISNPQLLSEFDYTGECIMSAVNSLLLFAVTPAGLEIWSVLGSSNGCLLRFYPFIGLKSVIATNRKLVLLSRFSNKENVSIAAYYNQNDSEAIILSDIRNVEKLNAGGKGMGSILPIFSTWKKQKRLDTIDRKRQTAEEKIIYSYNIYVLDGIELCEIYEDMLEKAFEIEAQDQEKYFKLLKEAHSLLQSKYYELVSEEQKSYNLVSLPQLKLELNSYTLLLRKSFSILGDVYIKLGNPDQASSCFANSDRPLYAVFQCLQSYPLSLLQYLEYVLYDESKLSIVQHNEEIGNGILSLYKKLASDRLSTLILESSLCCYSRSLAVSLLEQVGGEALNLPNATNELERILSSKLVYETEPDIEVEKIPDEAFDLSPNNLALPVDMNKEIEDKGNEDDTLLAWWSDGKPKDAFALMVLLLETGETHKAVKLLSCIDSQWLIEYCTSNSHLLYDENSGTIFSRAMRTYLPWYLLEILVRLISKTFNHQQAGRSSKVVHHPLDAKKDKDSSFSIESALNLLNSQEDSSLNNRMLCEYLLTVALMTRNETNEDNGCDYFELSMQLLKYYIEDLKEYMKLILSAESFTFSTSMAPKSIRSVSEIQEWCSFFNFSMLGYRHRWLNDMTEMELQEFMKSNPSTAQTFDFQKHHGNIRRTIVDLLEKEPQIANSTNISTNDYFSRLLYSLFNAQALLCFIGAEHESEGASSLIIPVESSNHFSSNDTDDDDVFIGAKTLRSRQQFKADLTSSCVTFYQKIKDELLNMSESFIGQISLQILCLTVISNYEQVFDILMKMRLDLSLIYAKHYCVQLHEWKYMTDRLLDLLKKSNDENEEQQQQLIEVFEKTLWYLAKTFMPEDFLTLIPNDGRIDYFLPFITYCFSCSCAVNCHNTMLAIQQKQE